MKELSLYLLDIAQNSLTAGASRLDITLAEDDQSVLTITIADNGRGMSPEFLATVTDPFTTTRTTRKVGLGLPLLRLAAELTGGRIRLESTLNVGTTVTAVFCRGHIDCPPMGDLPATVALLTQSCDRVALTLSHSTPKGEYTFSTAQIRAYLGEEISLGEPEICLWIQDYLAELEESV